MKPHKFFIRGILFCMLSGTCILAMDDPIEENKKKPQASQLYIESEFQKFMLLKEMTAQYKQRGDYIPEDVANKIIKTQREFYREAEEIAHRVNIYDYYNNGSISLTLPDDGTSNNFVLQLLCQKYPEMAFIDISTSTKITDLSPLKNMTHLRRIDINGCTRITDLSPFKDLRNLTRISMNGCTEIIDLSPLQQLQNLKQIYMNGCTGITDLSPLQGLQNLEVIFMDACTGITDKQVDALKQVLPRLDIYTGRILLKRKHPWNLNIFA